MTEVHRYSFGKWKEIDKERERAREREGGHRETEGGRKAHVRRK